MLDVNIDAILKWIWILLGAPMVWLHSQIHSQQIELVNHKTDLANHKNEFEKSIADHKLYVSDNYAKITEIQRLNERIDEVGRDVKDILKIVGNKQNVARPD